MLNITHLRFYNFCPIYRQNKEGLPLKLQKKKMERLLQSSPISRAKNPL